ncbi:MAG: hypothetical protein AAB558_00410 [Patescibacteria group bacterium]
MPRLNRSRNRNGALFLGFLVVAALIAVVAVKRAEPSSSTNANQTAATNNTNVTEGVGGGQVEIPVNENPPGTKTYTNEELGVTVYGVPTAKETVSGEITTIDFGGKDSLSVLSPDLEGIVRESIGSIAETTITIDGVSGLSLTGASAKDGSSRTLVLVDVNNKLFVFDVSAAFLAALLSNVEFKK